MTFTREYILEELIKLNEKDGKYYPIREDPVILREIKTIVNSSKTQDEFSSEIRNYDIFDLPNRRFDELCIIWNNIK